MYDEYEFDYDRIVEDTDALYEDDYFDDEYSFFRFTYLLDRKNTQNSQRNLYFQSGLDPENFDRHFYGLHGDWETRRWFVGFGYKESFNDFEDFSEKYLQFGIAPYLGKYGDLHTWLMFKTKKNSLGDSWSTYPVIKFFKLLYYILLLVTS